MPNEIEEYIATEETTVVQAMKKIDRGAKGILFIVDPNGRLIGCVTDGDIRRWLIETADLQACASKFMFKMPRFIFSSDNVDAQEYMERYSIIALPVLDVNKKIVDIIFYNNKSSKTKDKKEHKLFEVPVVIMAGGKGTRLYPYTKILPKPLIPIGDVPIIERIMNCFVNYGCKQFYLTVNYKKGMIKSYFEELAPRYDIKYVEEEKPLGTGGSLRLIKEKFDKPIFVTNCDILIQSNLSEMYEQHKKMKNDITIVSSLKNLVIPYGVLKVKEQGIIEEIQEKPSISNFVNTGMYIINPDLVELIPDETFYHMTDLVEECIKRGMKVGMYPISEDAFLDMGEFEQMKRMEEKLKV